MRRNSFRENSKSPTVGPGVIVCDIADQGAVALFPTMEVVKSPIICLVRSIEQRPELMIVRFSQNSARDRRYLLELCAALKRISRSWGGSVLVLLPAMHRRLLEELDAAKVDYVGFETGTALEPENLTMCLAQPDSRTSPRHCLQVLCPFLHYLPISGEHEMVVCGAYLDRLVLGGNRLHQLCETKKHYHCDHFLSPRPIQ